MQFRHSIRNTFFVSIQILLLIFLLTLGCDIFKTSPTVYIDPFNADQSDAKVYWDDVYKGSLIDQDDGIVIENVSKGEHHIKCYIYNVSDRDDFWDEASVKVNKNVYIKVSYLGIHL